MQFKDAWLADTLTYVELKTRDDLIAIFCDDLSAKFL